MLSFHNEQKIKDKYVARVIAHRKADNLIQGTGWKDGKGCAVGCTLEKYDHKAYEDELGIPEWLAKVEDTLFEGMSKEDAIGWPEDFLKAIPVGVDLEQVKASFLIFILQTALDTFDHEKFPDCKKSIDRVIDLYSSGETDLDNFHAARAAAAFAADATAAFAANAAFAADAADAAFAARAAAYAADAAYAAYATYAAARAAYAAYAAGGEYKKFANKLIEIMGDLK